MTAPKPNQNALVSQPTRQDLVPAGPLLTVREPRNTQRVLIIDNDASHAEAIAESLASERYDCTVALSGRGGAQLIRQELFDIIITDLVMNDVDGLEILQVAHSELPEARVIVVTGHATVNVAVSALKQGAFHFLEKPLDLTTLRSVVDLAARSLQLERRNVELSRRLDEKFGFEKIIGASPEIHRLIEQLQRIAPTNARVLILGETGTGKELVAQAIHQNSKRKEKRFVALNCAELSSQILESELFGHVKGAFTDASTDRKGRFEYAHGGTLFLDEVGDMPWSVQVKLLRVIETGEITRVGTNEPIKVDVRILSATNRDLLRAAAEGKFREDLYHRLNLVTVHLPPLRQRGQDIKLLMDVFVDRFAVQHGKVIRSVTTAVRRRFLAYPWPGNVRQLANKVEQMVVLDADGILDVDDLPTELLEAPALLPAASDGGLNDLVGKPLSEVERLFILETLKNVGGNREEAARLLDIGQRTLYRKLKEYDQQRAQIGSNDHPQT